MLWFVPVGLLVLVAVAQWWRRHNDPLRPELLARPVTFKAAVFVRRRPAVRRWGEHVYSHDLIVRGDLFEVSYVNCYRAEEVTVEYVITGLLNDWIEIAGPSGLIAIRWKRRIWSRRGDMDRQIWDALVSAGARPIGWPPPREATPARS